MAQEHLSKPISKVKKTCAQIAEMAGRMSAHTKLPTVNELCEQLQVSRATLDQALHELEERNIIYRLHAIGIFVSPQVRKTICVLRDPRNFQNDSSPFWPLIVEAHLRQARFFGFEAVTEDIIEASSQDVGRIPPALQKALSQGRIHGVIAICPRHEAVQALEQDFSHVPCVGVSAPGRWRVCLDRANAYNLAVRYLIKNGCRRIGIWDRVHAVKGMTQWLQLAMIVADFSPGLLDVALEIYPELIKLPPVHSRNQTTEQQGYDLAYEVFGPLAKYKAVRDQSCEQSSTQITNPPMLPNIPDGLIIANDLMARGALNAFDEMGVIPGRDFHLAVQTNSGSPVLSGEEHRLARLEFDMNQIARTALEILENCLRGRASVEMALVSPRLILPQQ